MADFVGRPHRDSAALKARWDACSGSGASTAQKNGVIKQLSRLLVPIKLYKGTAFPA